VVWGFFRMNRLSGARIENRGRTDAKGNPGPILRTSIRFSLNQNPFSPDRTSFPSGFRLLNTHRGAPTIRRAPFAASRTGSLSHVSCRPSGVQSSRVKTADHRLDPRVDW